MYRVKVGPYVPQVVDQNGNAVSNAHVIQLHFPSQTIATATGNVHVLSGPPTADILVGGNRISAVQVI